MLSNNNRVYCDINNSHYINFLNYISRIIRLLIPHTVAYFIYFLPPTIHYRSPEEELDFSEKIKTKRRLLHFSLLVKTNF